MSTKRWTDPVCGGKRVRALVCGTGIQATAAQAPGVIGLWESTVAKSCEYAAGPRCHSAARYGTPTANQ